MQKNTQGISHSVGSMLGQRRRRWANIEPTLGQYIMLACSFTCNIAGNHAMNSLAPYSLKPLHLRNSLTAVVAFMGYFLTR